MNEQLQEFARKSLIEGLEKCTEPQQMIFKRMYSHNDTSLSIEEVVSNMEEDKLDHALNQVDRTNKNNEKQKGSIKSI